MKRLLSLPLLAVIATLLLPTTTVAQSFGGALLNQDIMIGSDMAQINQNRSFGTSRSMAMGGAFSSLGGDLATTTINPAGLGMFSHDVVSFTPMLSIATSENTGVSSATSSGNSKTTFATSNIGANYTLVENSKGSLVALNGAVTYSRLADYNSSTSFKSSSTYSSDMISSLFDIYQKQLTAGEVYPKSDGSMALTSDPYYWPAQAAYQTYMLDPLDDNAGWTTNAIGTDASISRYIDIEQRGRLEEYSFSLGANIGNYLYLGATVGIQQLSQKTTYTYQENYSYSSGESTTASDPANYSNVWQYVKLSGSGVNLKLGAIARPFRALRVGVAYHSPTYYSIARAYQTDVYTSFPDQSYSYSSDVFIDSYDYSWQLSTPAKMLTGISWQIGAVGIISFDYERVWYNKMSVTYAPGNITPSQYEQDFEELYQPTNTFRLGVEIKPRPNIALRVGGGMSTSMLRDDTLLYSSPIATTNDYMTCGVGFQFTPYTSLDIAYQYLHQNYTAYRLFYAIEDEELTSYSPLYDNSKNYHYITATITWRI